MVTAQTFILQWSYIYFIWRSFHIPGLINSKGRDLVINGQDYNIVFVSSFRGCKLKSMTKSYAALRLNVISQPFRPSMLYDYKALPVLVLPSGVKTPKAQGGNATTIEIMNDTVHMQCLYSWWFAASNIKRCSDSKLVSVPLHKEETLGESVFTMNTDYEHTDWTVNKPR